MVLAPNSELLTYYYFFLYYSMKEPFGTVAERFEVSA
jgi:hypothetical protein